MSDQKNSRKISAVDETIHYDELVLGIDIGGTTTKFGFVAADGCVPFMSELRTQDFPQLKKAAQQIHAEVQEYRKHHDFHLMGIGVGAPDSNYHTGEIIRPHNLPFGTVNAAECFTEVFDIETFVTNDANCMALAEKKFGVASEFSNFIEITLGTGLGSGIITAGKLLVGKNGMAGEAGHICIAEGPRKCPCGGEGHLEAYVSAGGILQNAREAGVPEHVDGLKELNRLGTSGDPAALAAFDFTARCLGKGLAALVTLFCPEAIIIGGGISPIFPLIEKPLNRYLDQHVFRLFKGQTKILQSNLEPARGGIRGASVLIYENWVQGHLA